MPYNNKKIRYPLVLLLLGCFSCTHGIISNPKIETKFLKNISYTNSLGMEFAYIAPGIFMMGSPTNETGRSNDETLHRVTLTSGFYLQATEVTVGQWREFVRNTNYKTEAEKSGGAYTRTEEHWIKKGGIFWDSPGFSQSEQHPVTCISWDDAQAFVKWLNRKENSIYRLPTEAEWEYACRTGTNTPFSFGSCLSTDQANYDGLYPLVGCAEKGVSRKHTLPVASLAPNAWGLYDMHGSVWEWCQDWWGLYPSDSATDPKGPSLGSRWIPARVNRGGSWFCSAWKCRSGYRFNYPPTASDNTLGFRLVRVHDVEALSPNDNISLQLNEKVQSEQ